MAALAQLPDLDPNVITLIAWWDVGVTIQKSDILPILDSFTEYDNGIDGTILVGAVTVQIRVRTDGLILAYGLRSNEIASGATVSHGEVVSTTFNRSILYRDESTASGNITTTVGNTFLGDALDLLENAVTTAGKTPVVLADANYFDFEFDDVTTLYFLFLSKTVSGQSGVVSSGTFTVPAGQGIVVHAMGVYGKVGSFGAADNLNGDVALNGTDLFNIVFSGSIEDFDRKSHYRTGTELSTLLVPEGSANTGELIVNSDSGSSKIFSAVYVLWVEEP